MHSLARGRVRGRAGPRGKGSFRVAWLVWRECIAWIGVGLALLGKGRLTRDKGSFRVAWLVW